jgi:hypothetical protein
MQKLWGRILAGEIKQPQSFSLRTLELLKNISKKEAEVFTKFAQVSLNSSNQCFIYDADNGATLNQEFEITFADRLLLVSAGLLVSENNLELSYPAILKESTTVMIYGKKGFFINRKENSPKQGIPVVPFTNSGVELSSLIEPIYNEVYIHKIADAFKRDGVKVLFGDIIKKSPQEYQISNERNL